MRVFRFPLILALCMLATTLLGASPVQIGLPPPAVVIYPFTVNGDADKEAGGRLAVLFATQIAERGGVTVKPPPAGTLRADYLNAARAMGVDYYISGYVTPLGQEVSVVEQLVSAYSGTVVWSNTAQILTYADAAGQGESIRAAILRHAGRALAQLEAPSPQPQAAASAEPGTGNIIGRLFNKKAKNAPAASASATPAATAVQPQAAAAPQAAARPTKKSAPEPSARPAASPPPAAVAAAPKPATPAPAAAGPVSIAVLQTGGDAEPERRAFATQQLLAAFARDGRRAVAANDESGSDLAGHAADVCARTGAKELVGSSLSTRADDPQYGPITIAGLELTTFDCSGNVLFREKLERNGSGFGNKSWRHAIERAASAAVAATLRRTKGRG